MPIKLIACVWNYLFIPQEKFWRQVAILLMISLRSPEAVPKYDILPKRMLNLTKNQKLTKYRLLITYFSVKISHRAQQRCCRALCTISKRFNGWDICYGRTWFGEIWFEYAFRTGILNCNSLPSVCIEIYRKISNIRRIELPKRKWFSSRLAVFCAQSIGARC